MNNKLTNINGNLDVITATKDKNEKLIGSNNKLFSDFYFVNSLKGQNFIDDMESKVELHKNDINKLFKCEQLLLLLIFYRDIFEANIDN